MEYFSFLKKNTTRPALRGYTLLEMIVVLAIIGILLIGTIVTESTFNDTLLLTNAAYSIGLSLRDAQSYGLSSATLPATYDTGYGLHFEADNNSYLEFADIYPSAPGNDQSGACPGHTNTQTGNPEERPGDCVYESSGDVVVQSYTLTGAFTLSFCGVPAQGILACSNYPYAGNEALDDLNITFLRPDISTAIFAKVGGVNTYSSLSSATIKVTAPNGTSQECINISEAGEIAVGTCT